MAFEKSVIAPIMGAVKSKTRFEITWPSKYAVAVKLSIPCVQYSLKNWEKRRQEQLWQMQNFQHHMQSMTLLELKA